MTLSYLIIYVEDIEKACAFYQQAFDLELKFIHDSGTYAELKTGDVTLAFAKNEVWQRNTGEALIEGPKSGIEIAFTTDDVQK